MVYHWALLADLKAATRQTTYLDRVYDIRQRENKCPTFFLFVFFFFFLERAIETFQQHSPMDPESLEVKVAVTLVFIIQTAPDIKKNLQTVERLCKKSLRDLVIVVERVFNRRDYTREADKRTKATELRTHM